MKKILPLFSYVFHPIFIPAMATLLYLFCTDASLTSQEQLFVFFQIVVVTMVLPLLLFVLLQTAGNIDSMMLAKISQRKIPLLLHCFLLILLVKKCITIERYTELHFFLLAALLSTLLALILLFANIKASLHMMSISSLLVFAIGLSLHFKIQNTVVIAVLILLNGFVASSRLEMQAHSYKEMVFGFLLGAVPQLLLLVLWL